MPDDLQTDDDAVSMHAETAITVGLKDKLLERLIVVHGTPRQDVAPQLRQPIHSKHPATRMIMAYGFGKPVQPLAGVMQETQHRVLEVRWMPPRADDHSKCVDLAPGE